MTSYPKTCWLDPRGAAGPSPIADTGLFATAPIVAGEVVMRLGGEVLTDDEFRDRTRHMDHYSGLAIDNGLNLLLPDDGPTNFGNHSRDSNLWMDDAVTVSARRDIAPGDGLTIDYALQTADLSWSMRCTCGSPVCCVSITNEDWHRPELQQRYAGHFSPFINRRIAALRRT